MTKLLDHAIAAVSELPVEMQDEIARIMLRFSEAGETYFQLTPEEEASFAKSLDQAAKGEFASDDSVRALFQKYAS